MLMHELISALPLIITGIGTKYFFLSGVGACANGSPRLTLHVEVTWALQVEVRAQVTHMRAKVSQVTACASDSHDPCTSLALTHFSWPHSSSKKINGQQRRDRSRL